MVHLRVLGCHESWDAMSPTQRGRYCEQCELEVVDTSSFDRTQLDGLLAEPKRGRTCVRVIRQGNKLMLALGVAASITVSLAGCATPGHEQGAVQPTTSYTWLSPQASPRAGGHQIAGYITTKEGEFVEGAIVSLQASALPHSLEQLTGSDGKYIFKDLPSGTYTVQVLYGANNVSKIVTLDRQEQAKFRANFRLDKDKESVLVGVLIRDDAIEMTAESSMTFTFDH